MAIKTSYMERTAAAITAQRLKRVQIQKKMRKKLAVARAVHIGSFCLVLFVMGILSLLLPKPTVSEVEKRELAAMPEFSTDALVAGTYTRDLELHYADTFPMRDMFVSFAALLDEWRGVRFDGVRIHSAKPQAQAPAEQPEAPPAAVAPDAGDSLQAQQEPVQEEIRAPAFEAVDDGAIGEQNGAVFVYKDRAMSMFGGTQAASQYYAEVINKYHAAWGDKVRIYNVIVPTAIEFYLPERYRDVTNPQQPNIDNIYSMLDEDVVAVDAYSEIAAHAGEYVYFNADHHWTALGAYYAYSAFARSAGFEPVALQDCEKRTIENFKGTMYTYTNDAKLGEDHVDYYIVPTEESAVRYDVGAPYTPTPHSVWADYAQGVNSYSVFLHGDFPLIQVETGNKNGKKALVVKESFGNAFAPYLIAHYEEVHIVDQRYFELNLKNYVLEKGIDDVIFMNNIFAANTESQIAKTEALLFK